MTTRILKLLVVFVLTVFLYNCGSSHNVIHDGKVYEVKGSEFYQAGVDVTESLSEEKRSNIKETLNERLKQDAEFEAKQKALDKKQKEQEKIQKQAEKQQKELEKRQEAIEKAQKEKDDARKAMVKASNKLKKEQRKYDRLLEKGKLSPKDIEKWEEKLEKLKAEKAEAEEKFNTL